jgi:hypothetical protein
MLVKRSSKVFTYASLPTLRNGRIAADKEATVILMSTAVLFVSSLWKDLPTEV